MDRQKDFPPLVSKLMTNISKGYLWLIPFFIAIYVFFFVTKALAAGEWSKMPVISWFIYYYGIGNLWISWVLSIYYLLFQTPNKKNQYLVGED